MKKQYIFGNWKMNGSLGCARELAAAIAPGAVPAQAEVALFPPFPLLGTVAQALQDSPVAWGAQDCSAETEGAFTGEVSAVLLKEMGCRYVLAGHSERRTLHHEGDSLVRRKAEAAIAAGLVPVICVGEDLARRESGNYLEVIDMQVKQSVPPGDAPIIIAYEPIWAIGSGKVPSIQEITQVHKTIASRLASATSGARVPILYGGSVKAANAASILSGEGVDGLLVGGASLKAEEFRGIISAI